MARDGDGAGGVGEVPAAAVANPCPRCGGAMLPAIYGYPFREDFEAEDRQEVVLMGCLVPAEEHLFAAAVCRACGTEVNEAGAVLYDGLTGRDERGMA